MNPSTTYSVVVTTRRAGEPDSVVPAGRWSFATAALPGVHPIRFVVDLKREPVRWHGQFFSGICNVVFCTQAANYGPTYDLMAEARKQHPDAWSYQRDFWTTGFEDRPPGFLAANLPNIVRERETRRIAAIESHEKNVVLRVEDFFGHKQYGIAVGRPVSEDFHPGDEVLIADGVHDARTKVIAADSAGGTVTVAPFRHALPAGGKSPTSGRCPNEKTRMGQAPFPPGGCYLRKFKAARNRVLLLGQARQGVGLRAYRRRRPPAAAQSGGCTWRPFSRRTELDDGQGLRAVA